MRGGAHAWCPGDRIPRTGASRCGCLRLPRAWCGWLHGSGQAGSPVREGPMCHAPACTSPPASQAWAPGRTPGRSQLPGGQAVGRGPCCTGQLGALARHGRGQAQGQSPAPASGNNGVSARDWAATAQGGRRGLLWPREALPSVWHTPGCLARPPDKLLSLFSPQLTHAPRSLLDSTPTPSAERPHAVGPVLYAPCPSPLSPCSLDPEPGGHSHCPVSSPVT